MVQPAIQGISFFSTNGGKTKPRAVPDPKPPVIVRSNCQRDTKDFIAKLRKEWPIVCRSIFAESEVSKTWDIRWFFDKYDFHVQGGEFLYNVILTIMHENEADVVGWSRDWTEKNQNLVPYLMTDHASTLTFFHKQDHDKHGETFIRKALEYMRSAFVRACVEERSQAEVAAHSQQLLQPFSTARQTFDQGLRPPQPRLNNIENSKTFAHNVQIVGLPHSRPSSNPGALSVLSSPRLSNASTAHSRPYIPASMPPPALIAPPLNFSEQHIPTALGNPQTNNIVHSMSIMGPMGPAIYMPMSSPGMVQYPLGFPYGGPSALLGHGLLFSGQFTPATQTQISPAHPGFRSLGQQPGGGHNSISSPVMHSSGPVYWATQEQQSSVRSRRRSGSFDQQDYSTRHEHASGRSRKFSNGRGRARGNFSVSSSRRQSINHSNIGPDQGWEIGRYRSNSQREEGPWRTEGSRNPSDRFADQQQLPPTQESSEEAISRRGPMDDLSGSQLREITGRGPQQTSATFDAKGLRNSSEKSFPDITEKTHQARQQYSAEKSLDDQTKRTIQKPLAAVTQSINARSPQKTSHALSVSKTFIGDDVEDVLKLWVGNAGGSTEDELHDAIIAVAVVKKVSIRQPKANPRGPETSAFAFIEFLTTADARRVLKHPAIMCNGVKLHFEVAGLFNTSDSWPERSPAKSGYENRDNLQRLGMYTNVRTSPRPFTGYHGLPRADPQARTTTKSLDEKTRPQAVYSLQDARSCLETSKLDSQPEITTRSGGEFMADKLVTSKIVSVSDPGEPHSHISNSILPDGDRKLDVLKQSDYTSPLVPPASVSEFNADRISRNSETGKNQTNRETPHSKLRSQSLKIAAKSDGGGQSVGADLVATAITVGKGDRVKFHEEGIQKGIQPSADEKRKLTPSKTVIPALPKAQKMAPKINAGSDASTIQASISTAESVTSLRDKLVADDAAPAGIHSDASRGMTVSTWPKVDCKPDEDVASCVLADFDASRKELEPNAIVSVKKDMSAVELCDQDVLPATDKCEWRRNHADVVIGRKPDIIEEAASESNLEGRSDRLQHPQTANNSKQAKHKTLKSSTESLTASYQQSKPDQVHANQLLPGRLQPKLEDVRPQPSESQPVQPQPSQSQSVQQQLSKSQPVQPQPSESPPEALELEQAAVDQPQKESRMSPDDEGTQDSPRVPGEICTEGTFSSQGKPTNSKQTIPMREITKAVLIGTDLADWQKEYQQVMDLVKTATGPAKAAWTQETENLRKGLVDAEGLLAELEGKISNKKTAKKAAMKKVRTAVESHKRNAEELSLLYGRILRDAEEKSDKAKAYPALHESDARYQGVSARRQASSDHNTLSQRQTPSLQQTSSNCSDSSNRMEHPLRRGQLYNVESSSDPARPGDVFASDTADQDTPSIDSILDQAVAGRGQASPNMTVQHEPGQSDGPDDQGTVVILVVPNVGDYLESCQVDTPAGNPRPAVDRGLNNYGQRSPFDYILKPKWSHGLSSETEPQPVQITGVEGTAHAMENGPHRNGQQNPFEHLSHPRPSSQLNSPNQSGPVNMSTFGGTRDNMEGGQESHERQASIDGVIDPRPRPFSDIVRSASPPARSSLSRRLDTSTAPAVQKNMQAPTGNENMPGRPTSPSTRTSSLLSVRPTSPTYAGVARPSSPTYADIAKSKSLANGAEMERRTSNASNGSSAPLARRPSNSRGKMSSVANPSGVGNGKARAMSPGSGAGSAGDRTMSPEGRNAENRGSDDWKVGPEGEWGSNGLRLRGVPPAKGG